MSTNLTVNQFAAALTALPDQNQHIRLWLGESMRYLHSAEQDASEESTLLWCTSSEENACTVATLVGELQALTKQDQTVHIWKFGSRRYISDVSQDFDGTLVTLTT